MPSRTITLTLPESVYIRLQQAAQATQQTLDAMFLRAVEIGSPPNWQDVPAEFQADVAALDRLTDKSLWHIARMEQHESEQIQYQNLLDKNRNGTLSDAEREQLRELRLKADRLMLCKAQAVALLHWRGYQIPSANQMRVQA